MDAYLECANSGIMHCSRLLLGPGPHLRFWASGERVEIVTSCLVARGCNSEANKRRRAELWAMTLPFELPVADRQFRSQGA